MRALTHDELQALRYERTQLRAALKLHYRSLKHINLRIAKKEKRVEELNALLRPFTTRRPPNDVEWAFLRLVLNNPGIGHHDEGIRHITADTRQNCRKKGWVVFDYDEGWTITPDGREALARSAK